MCLDAEVEIASTAGTRRIALHDFYTGLGENHRRFDTNELLTRIFLPASSAGFSGVYRKLRVRGSIDYPLAGVAVAMKRSNGHVSDARIGITAVNPAPMLVNGASELLAGKVMDEVSGGVGWRLGRKDRKAADDFGAYSGISARDDSRLHQARSSRSGAELSPSAMLLLD